MAEIKGLDTYFKMMKILGKFCGVGQGISFIFVLAAAVVAAAAALIFGVFLVWSLFPLLSAAIFHGVRISFYTETFSITPAPWLFYVIWPAVMLAAVILIGYTIGSFIIFFPGAAAISSPPILSAPIFANLVVGFLLGVFYLFFWDKFLLFPRSVGLAFNVGSALFFLFAAAIGAVRFARYNPTLIAEGRAAESIFLRIVLVNGLAGFATWLLYLQAFETTFVISFGNNETASVIVISTILAVMTIYFLLDITVIEPYTRFLISTYLVILIAMIATLNRSFNPASLSSLIVAATAVLSGLYLGAKIVISLYTASLMAKSVIRMDSIEEEKVEAKKALISHAYDPPKLNSSRLELLI